MAVISDSPVGFEDHSKSAGAPETESELTPAMIQAGEDLLMDWFDSIPEHCRQAAILTFLEMMHAFRKSRDAIDEPRLPAA